MRFVNIYSLSDESSQNSHYICTRGYKLGFLAFPLLTDPIYS